MKMFFTVGGIAVCIVLSIFLFQKNTSIITTDFYTLENNKKSEVSIITIDTKKSSVLFGGIDYFKKDSKYFSEFHRHSAGEFLQKIKKILPKTALVINGQFFNAGQEKTHMSFPLKSNGKVINDYMDNDIAKRTLLQKDTGEFVLYEGYNSSDLTNDSVKELIVGFSPEVDANSQMSLGRNYVVLNDTSLIFFLANAKTQSEMEDIITKAGYSLDNAIMFDGGPSAQYASLQNGKTYYGDWEVPQFFVIGER